MELPVHSQPFSDIKPKCDVELNIIVLEFRKLYRFQQCLMYYMTTIAITSETWTHWERRGSIITDCFFTDLHSRFVLHGEEEL